ncbi:hypothetical protein V4F39_08955 [Aquincola sp. MAHUQ-54]|uniref:DUF4276 family protein n=1 Tax=Aquincola agrisoli TaxID=3119538 RepID=A0AAW9Q2H0_9BURK
MAIAPIALATEDVLSESIGQRLLAELPPVFLPPLLLRRDGAGYLRAGMNKWRQLAQRQAVVVLTDLDNLACPLALLDNWYGAGSRPPDLLLRVAVREAEAWLLADHDAMKQLLGASAVLPPDPDRLPDPKQHLLQLARRAPRDVRRDLVKEAGAVSSQGIGYNARLTSLVSGAWSPERAAQRSPSLGRARVRLAQLAQRRMARPGPAAGLTAR